MESVAIHSRAGHSSCITSVDLTLNCPAVNGRSAALLYSGPQTIWLAFKIVVDLVLTPRPRYASIGRQKTHSDSRIFVAIGGI